VYYYAHNHFEPAEAQVRFGIGAAGALSSQTCSAVEISVKIGCCRVFCLMHAADVLTR
jgi:hypothetical protein